MEQDFRSKTKINPDIQNFAGQTDQRMQMNERDDRLQGKKEGRLLGTYERDDSGRPIQKMDQQDIRSNMPVD
jgi:hypothetical protein